MPTYLRTLITLALVVIPSLGLSQTAAHGPEMMEYELRDDAYLNRVAEAFGLPKEHPSVLVPVDRPDSSLLSADQILEKDRLIGEYLLNLRFGKFAAAQATNLELSRYSQFLWRFDFYDVASRSGRYLQQMDDHDFALFPAFYERVYRRVVSVLGSEYRELNWPIGVLPLHASGKKYYVVIVSLASPQAVFLLEPGVGVTKEDVRLGDLCTTPTIRSKLNVLDSEVLSVNYCGNCGCQRLFYVQNRHIEEVTVLHRKGDFPRISPNECWFMQECGTIGGGIDCNFVKNERGEEDLVCSGYDHQYEDERDVYAHWRGRFAWDDSSKAFVEIEYRKWKD